MGGLYSKISHNFLRTKLSILDLVAVAVLLDSEIFWQFVEHGGRDWCLEIEMIWHVASQTFHNKSENITVISKNNCSFKRLRSQMEELKLEIVQ